MADRPQGDEPDAAAAGEPTRPLGAEESLPPEAEPTAAVGGEPTSRLDRTTVGSGAAGAGATATRAGPAGVPPEEDRDRQFAWVLWGLLALLIVGLVAWLLLRDEGNGDEADVVTDDTVPAEVEEQEPADEPPLDDAEPGDGQADNGTAPVDDAPVDDAPADDAPADDAPVDDGPGELRAGDEALFPVPDDLSAFEGDDVRGEGVLVHSVVEALGFWIGDDDENRIFVRVEPGLDTGGFVVEEGDRVDLEGTVRANDPDDVDPPDDAGGDRYREQGHHIELRSLEPAS